MEKGLVRAVKTLQEFGIKIGTLVTDRHSQINKWILSGVEHYYDVWHVAKGMHNSCSKTLSLGIIQV